MSTVQHKRNAASIAVATPLTSDLVDIFIKRNPRSPRRAAEAAGKVTAALGRAVVALPAEQQRRLASSKTLTQRVLTMLAGLDANGHKSAQSAEATDEDAGEGLGGAIAISEGRRRLRAYATPLAIEDWAGPVAGPTELEQRLGIARSTLHDWQKQSSAIGLLKGTRKHVFPLEQFVDGRPVEGLAEIVALAGAARIAWSWLIERHPSLDGRKPLHLLKIGKAADALALAERDFGQS